MALKFFNLHGHTSYSLYDAIGGVQEHANWMLQNAGEDSGGFAITDHGHLNAAGEIAAIQKRAKEKGQPLKLIYGCEFYFVPSLEKWRLDKEQSDILKKEQKENKLKKIEQDEEGESDLVIENEQESKSNYYYNPINRRNHLVVCAINQTGLKNLFRLVSRSYREGFYKKPRIDFALLEKFNEGLLASTACLHKDNILITSCGMLTIENVVKKINNDENIYVLAYDINKEVLKFEKVLWGGITKTQVKLIKITLENGKEVKLTPDHKVFTNYGYIEAKQLTKEHKILALK